MYIIGNMQIAEKEMIVKVAIAQKSASKSLGELYHLWSVLGEIPTVFEADAVDTIERPFLHFPVGTPRETIWHWFEEQNASFVVGNVMQGIRVAK